MPTAWFDGTIAWITAHPRAAGLLILLIALCDAIAVVGIVVPALPLLFAVGALVGLGHIDGPYAVACAAIGAFIGDGLSYWIGHRWGPQMHRHWPFSRYPQLLDRGERVFRRHGSKGLLIARFVGAVRPFVPAIAGMLRMPLRRYLPVSLFACVLWAAAFLAPGWIFGKSYEAVAAVADRLALVLCALLAAVALVWAGVLYTWRWFASPPPSMSCCRTGTRRSCWCRRHPPAPRPAPCDGSAPTRRTPTPCNGWPWPPWPRAGVCPPSPTGSSSTVPTRGRWPRTSTSCSAPAWCSASASAPSG
jgi:membrane protein DedA with SNARE-associated domain